MSVCGSGCFCGAILQVVIPSGRCSSGCKRIFSVVRTGRFLLQCKLDVTLSAKEGMRIFLFCLQLSDGYISSCIDQGLKRYYFESSSMLHISWNWFDNLSLVFVVLSP
ncbi:hypothetical protein KC19_5G063500 [Ceratodon purpureus]|uniref:Uncharacterized protein n=1 Tax=Ceratodon purpureus TaxID=3225 RepID=A0A8T0HZY0_CERPU|nr:hypothetical protein KC19_5G063500 [Ceratodon purpureus]